MKRFLAVVVSAVFVLVLGLVSGYLVVTLLVPYVMSAGSRTESEAPAHRVYQRTDGTERELTPSSHWVFRHYIMTIPTPDPTPTPIPAQIAAREDFSPEAGAVVDSSGYLNLPDNTTVEDVSLRKLKTKYFSVLMPGAWVDNVVIECKYINEITESGREDEKPVYDTILLRFFEKNSYEMYKSKVDRSTYSSGLLTELRYSSTTNDNAWLKTSNYQNYWAAVRLGVRTYDVFIYEPNSQVDLIAEKYKERYLYLMGINYEGCFINTFKVNGDGEVTLADDYIRKGFVDSWDPDAEGIPDGSVIPGDIG